MGVQTFPTRACVARAVGSRGGTRRHAEFSMSSSMEFWATCVKPNKPVKVTVQDGMTLRLTQVAPHHLARGRASRGGRERVRRQGIVRQVRRLA